MVYSRFVGAHMSQKGRCDTVSSFQQIFLTRICPGTCSNIAFDKKKIRWRFINRCNNNNNKMDVNLISEYVEIMSAWIIIIKQISWMVMPKGHDRPLATNECVCVFFSLLLFGHFDYEDGKNDSIFFCCFSRVNNPHCGFFCCLCRNGCGGGGVCHHHQRDSRSNAPVKQRPSWRG